MIYALLQRPLRQISIESSFSYFREALGPRGRITNRFSRDDLADKRE